MFIKKRNHCLSFIDIFMISIEVLGFIAMKMVIFEDK